MFISYISFFQTGGIPMAIKKERPRIAIPRSAIDNSTDIIAAAAVIFMFAYIAYFWSTLPEQVPMHANFAGVIDRYGSRCTLWFIPVTAAVLVIFLTIISRFPHVFNYAVEINEQNAPAQYRNALSLMAFIKAEIAISFSCIVLDFVNATVTNQPVMRFGVYFFIVGGLIFFGTMGFFVYRAYKLK